MTTDRIDHYADVIDSRDVIARIDTLRAERDAYVDDNGDPSDWTGDCEDDAHELATLEKLADEASGYSADWEYGETLIRDSYFTDYARELCEDIGDMPKGFPSYIEIDWEATARNIQQDYTAVDFDDVTYWVR